MPQRTTPLNGKFAVIQCELCKEITVDIPFHVQVKVNERAFIDVDANKIANFGPLSCSSNICVECAVTIGKYIKSIQK